MQNDARKPNLFIIGSMKSGTSSLHAYIDQHPEIFMSREKEPGFFLDEFTWHNGFDWYLDLFAGGEQARYRGESSTHYTKLPRFSGAVERLQAYCPEARLVYIMRDPIKRAISHYWHMVMSHDEKRAMFTAIQEDSQYRDVSNYVMQLTPYREAFPTEQIYTLTFEELIANPRDTLRAMFSWLGVDADFQPSNAGEGYNVGAKTFVKARRSGLLQRFRFSPFWDVASRLVPKPVRSLGRRLAEKEYDRSTEAVEPVIDYLRPIMQPQVTELCRLLHREFPEWTTLYGDSHVAAQINEQD